MTAPIPFAGARDALKVGMAVSRLTGPAWIKALARALIRTGYVDLTFIVTDERPLASPRGRRRRGHLWPAYLEVDLRLQRIACRRSPDPSALADLADLGCTVATSVPDELHLVVDAAGRFALDPRADHCGAPVWWFDHDGHEMWPAVRSGYAEALDGRGVTSCRLMGLAPGAAAPAVLRSARLATHPLFGAENRVQLLWKSIPLLLQKVRELRDSGVVTCESRSMPHEQEPAVTTEAGPGVSPVALALHAWRSVGFVLRRVFWHDQWFLLLGQRAVAENGQQCEQVDKLTSEFRPTRALMPPADRFWADPYLLPRGEDRLILVEEYMYAQHRGRIALLRLDDSGGLAEVRTVLERECHLSYPAVFEHAGELFMVPESSDLDRIEAYRCTRFPWRWEDARTLLAGVRACDSSIVEYGGRWWLFATVVDDPWLTPRDSLNAYYADDPLNGPWVAHPGNPVVCDVYRARPAGRPFICDERLFRPSQDCSRGYGYGIRINEIIALTETRFEERDVAFLEPAWRDAVAAHTFALGERTIVVDAMRWLGRRPGSRSGPTAGR